MIDLEVHDAVDLARELSKCADLDTYAASSTRSRRAVRWGRACCIVDPFELYGIVITVARSLSKARQKLFLPKRALLLTASALNVFLKDSSRITR